MIREIFSFFGVEIFFNAIMVTMSVNTLALKHGMRTQNEDEEHHE